MFGLGIGELVVILLVLVLLFGASRLPQLGAGLGEGIKSFRKAFRDIREEDEKLPPARTEAPKPEPAEKQASSQPSSQGQGR
ncbi:MAG TPA: twin-arginine translocase TatA/TatE family subunit [Anaeromyxobacteraceae bacterium]|jgi:sec-independent protein translocase protein TatA|nr:twin-arginine translocase TatA/TatE family subunit [Anaeromyxobacteraceae bacterium]